MKLRESPKFKTIINNFLKIKLFNNNRLTIGKIRDKTIFELLKDFVRQSAQEEESKDRGPEAYHTNVETQMRPMTELEKAAWKETETFFNHATKMAQRNNIDKDKLLYCAQHGLNPSHSTTNCRYLQNNRTQSPDASRYAPQNPITE